MNVVKDATHSETLLLLTLANSFSEKLNEIVERHENKNIHVLGSALLISSLNDPCTDNCLPMLNEFGRNLRNILINRIPPSKGDKITLAQNLGNLILLAGRQEFIHSRQDAHVSIDTIVLNFDHPQTQVFSVQSEHLN